MLVAVASRKGSPGVTTLAALIGAYWHQPGTTRLLVEADPSGGSLAARWSAAHDLTWDPGLLSLSTSRQTISLDLLPTVAQRLADDLWVAAAPPGPDQVEAGLLRLGDAGAAGLAAAPGLVAVADCGRLRPTMASMVLARRAALTVLVCRPRLDEVHALVPAVAELRAAGCTLGLVCVGDRPYTPDDVAASLGVDLLGTLPEDDRAADALDIDGLAAGRPLRRSRLVAETTDIVSRIQARCAERVGPTAPTEAAASPPPAPTFAPPQGVADATAEPAAGEDPRTPAPDPARAGPAPAHRAEAPPAVASSAEPPSPEPPSLEPSSAEPPSAEPSTAGPGAGPGRSGRTDRLDHPAVARQRERLVAAGMDGPLSPAMMAARASAAARISPSDEQDDE